jgi:hypothetical protein
MCVNGLLPTTEEGGEEGGFLLTLTVPAPDGCNLRCKFCFIKQRRPNAATLLQPQHYRRFIAAMHAAAPIYAVAIQGHEPLLPQSQAYTKTILEECATLGLPVNIVTNGVYLAAGAAWLHPLRPANIAVSLDSASAAPHDRLRRKKGTWDAAVAGIAQAKTVLGPHANLAVASVLMPESYEWLRDMPSLMRRLDVKFWILTPLLAIRGDKPGGIVADKGALYRDIERLQEAADKAGVVLVVDDELGCLQHRISCIENPERARFRVRVTPPNVQLVRLDPGGEWALGQEVLRRISSDTPRWRPGIENESHFIARLMRLVVLKAEKETAYRRNAEKHRPNGRAITDAEPPDLRMQVA